MALAWLMLLLMIRNSAFATENRTRVGHKARPPLFIYRTALGFTQRELAEKAEVAPETISNVERGIHLPQRATARALAIALDVPVEELFPGLGERSG